MEFTEDKQVFLTECPRDAMQGIKEWIPTETKAAYLNTLLKCGFDTLDFGSFVSPKAIPQLSDTREVLSKLELAENPTRLLAIVANDRGAQEAVHYDEITFLGYPFSISETFQQRNTNASIQESLKRVESIQNACIKADKGLVLYISMGFGNPYGDAWNPELVAEWSDKLHSLFRIRRLALSDTIGAATPEAVHSLFSTVIPQLPEVTFGAHLHTVREAACALTKAAYEAGCRHFDGAIKGYGGCPMAKDDLTGNMPTEIMLDCFSEQGIATGIDEPHFAQAMLASSAVFHTM